VSEHDEKAIRGPIKGDLGEYFEERACATLKACSVDGWGDVLKIIPHLDRSTAGRIVSLALHLCGQRRESPSKELIEAVDQLLVPQGASRNRARNPELHARIIAYVATHPGAFGREIARECKTSPQTVKVIRSQPRFWRDLAGFQGRLGMWKSPKKTD